MAIHVPFYVSPANWEKFVQMAEINTASHHETASPISVLTPTHKKPRSPPTTLQQLVMGSEISNFENSIYSDWKPISYY